MDVRYRTATPRDAYIAARVIGAGFATYAEFAAPGWRPRNAFQEEAEVNDRLNRGDVHARLALAGDMAVGFAGWQPARAHTPSRDPIPGRAHLWSLFVLPDWWGTGVATTLLDWAVTTMTACGFESAQLWAVRDNARARAFYEREGWTTDGADKYSPELDLDLVFYERGLGGG